jgi:hypothetical protein
MFVGQHYYCIAPFKWSGYRLRSVPMSIQNCVLTVAQKIIVIVVTFLIIFFVVTYIFLYR